MSLRDGMKDEYTSLLHTSIQIILIDMQVMTGTQRRNEELLHGNLAPSQCLKKKKMVFSFSFSFFNSFFREWGLGGGEKEKSCIRLNLCTIKGEGVGNVYQTYRWKNGKW